MRLYEKQICRLLLNFFILVYTVTSHVVFTVEENNVTTPTRHFHRIRHSRVSSPYLTASSSINTPRESFSLNCPHVVDSSNKDVNIEVVWTLNETVWLKIENGHQRVVNGESTFNKRRVSGKTVMRLLLNNARYLFDYDELTGDFSMEICPVLWSSDCGAWQCRVTVRQSEGQSHTLTSRRRIKKGDIGTLKEARDEERTVMKMTNENVPFSSEIEYLPTKNGKGEGIEEGERVEFTKSLKDSSAFQLQKREDRSSDNWPQQVASFSRNSDDNVYMTRKSEEISSNVVFARTDGSRRHHHKPVRQRELERLFDAQIDYELDMSADYMYYPNSMNSHAKTRSAQYYNNGVKQRLYFALPLSIFFVFLGFL